RQRRSGDTVGCAAGVCWKCMNKASKDKLGAVRTTKAEFASLGEEAWWMHEAGTTRREHQCSSGIRPPTSMYCLAFFIGFGFRFQEHAHQLIKPQDRQTIWGGNLGPGIRSGGRGSPN
ncbi:unnamed protein product, partial [Prorocentrum cordatum]